MAKGMSRRNKEVRKPKAEKPPVAANTSMTSSEAFAATLNAPKKK